MKNIGFNDSGYVIKPPQPSSTMCGALPFTGNPSLHLRDIAKTQKSLKVQLFLVRVDLSLLILIIPFKSVINLKKTSKKSYAVLKHSVIV